MFWRQAPERENNRAPWPTHPRPRSRAVYGPAGRLPNAETPTHWSPYSFTVPTPYLLRGHDGLSGALMSVEQADLYDASPNPFPANGVWDEPNAWHGVMGLLRLPPHTSAHPGLTLVSDPPTPTMLFQAPPIFGLQTVPIAAMGV